MVKGFEDSFAYAVEIARLRDGLAGTAEFLRGTSSTQELERVLSGTSRSELNRVTMMAMRSRKSLTEHGITIEEYNDAWAAVYLAQVERGEAPNEEKT